MSGLSEQIRIALNAEGGYLTDSISQSISANGQTASGRTQQSLRFDIEGNTLFVYAMNNLFSLEDGVHPNDVKGLTKNYFAMRLYQWSIDKGLSFANNKERATFAYRVEKKIRNSGSRLFGIGRKDVYSDKVDISMQRLSDKLGDLIVNYKILK